MSRFAWGLLLVGAGLMAGAEDWPPVSELPKQAALPDPFTLMDGSKVETPEDWYTKRRPELKSLFQHYMYGFAPDAPKIEAQVLSEDTVFDGKATLRQIEISYPDLSDAAPRIRLALFTPTNAAAAPVFLGMNKCGNQTIADIPELRKFEDRHYHDSCTKGSGERGYKEDFWCVEYLIDRGYAFAGFHESDIDPDLDDFTDGIHAAYPDFKTPEGASWSTIRAWAWGLHRAVDYLITDPAIDPERVALIGHSRRGKTALLAAALDERVALVVPHQSGTGGAALSRDNDQETVERINRVFPHWFNGNFKFFNDNEAQLPIDQHLLMALVAPRPLLDTMGKKDTWANYESSLRAAKAADPVYKYLGAPGQVGEGLLMDADPVTQESAGNLLQYRLDTKHTLNQDYWKVILDFADLWMTGK